MSKTGYNPAVRKVIEDISKKSSKLAKTCLDASVLMRANLINFSAIPLKKHIKRKF